MEVRTARSCNQVTYHEAGHIILAYMNGYRCESVELNRRLEGGMDTWNARTYLDFQQDSWYVNRFTGMDAEVDFFEKLDLTEREKSIAVAHRLTQVLLAGSIAEQLYISEFNFHHAPVIDRIDQMKVEFINHILSRIDAEHQPALFIPSAIQDTVKAFQSVQAFSALSHLSGLLKAEKKVSAIQIELIVESLYDHHAVTGKRA